MTPTRLGTNGATHTIGRLPKSASRAPGIHGRGVDEVRRDLHAGDEIARLDDLAVERGEDLERVDPVEPLELGDPDVEDAGGLGEQVDPALGRAAHGQPGARHGRRQAEGRIVLVELPGLGDEDGDRIAGLARGERGQVVRGQPAALRPALAGDGQVARQDGPDQARRERADPG